MIRGMIMKFIRKDRLKHSTDLMSPLTTMDRDKYCFRSGTINAWRTGILISSKTEIDFFEGYIPCTILKELISRCDDGYLEVGPYEDDLMFRLRGNVKSHIYTSPPKETFPDIDLWDTSIEWRDCPADLVEGIVSVAFITKRPYGDLEPRIVVFGQYIIAAREALECRCRLESRAPFDMLFCPGRIMNVFSKLKNRQNLRVARYNGDANCELKGIAFDFGETRIFYGDEQKESNMRTELYNVENQNDIIEHNKLFDEGVEHLFELSTEMKNMAKEFIKILQKQRNCRYLLQFNIDNDKFQIGLGIAGVCRIIRGVPFVPHSPLPAIIFTLASRKCFFDVLPKADLMGFGEVSRQPESSETSFLLYFKNAKYETLCLEYKPDDRIKEESK